jgi:hypothetical protein
MLESPIFLLIALALLVAYLWFRMESRRRAEEAKWQAWKDMPDGTGLDVARLASEIQRLRENHLAALHVRPHESYYRRGLLAVFRKLVTGRALFLREHLEHEPQKHDA